MIFTPHSEADTTMSMYPGSVGKNGLRSEQKGAVEREGEGSSRREGKVDLVCEAVRTSLVELGENR